MRSLDQHRVEFDRSYKETAALVGESNFIGFPSYLSGNLCVLCISIYSNANQSLVYLQESFRELPS